MDTPPDVEVLSPDLPRDQIYGQRCRVLLRADRQLVPSFSRILPELAPLIGFDQRSPHHAYDLMTHVAMVVEQVPRDLALRWAALLHDIGKIPTFTQDETGRGHFYGHARAGAAMARQVLEDLGAPEALSREVVALIAHHMISLEPDREALLGQVDRFGWEMTE